MTDALSYSTNPTSDTEASDAETMSHAQRLTLPRDLEQTRARLRPLKHVEMLLISELVPETEQEATSLHGLSSSTPRSLSSGSEITAAGHSRNGSQAAAGGDEVFVRPNALWKRNVSATSQTSNAKGKERAHSRSSSGDIDMSGESPQTVLNACHRDILTLWENPLVREILKKRKIRMEEFPGLLVS